jgi:hypothetical protein
MTRITNARRSAREWLQRNEQYLVCFVTPTTPWKSSYEVFVLNYEQQQLTSEIKLKVCGIRELLLFYCCCCYYY